MTQQPCARPFPVPAAAVGAGSLSFQRVWLIGKVSGDCAVGELCERVGAAPFFNAPSNQACWFLVLWGQHGSNQLLLKVFVRLVGLSCSHPSLMAMFSLQAPWAQ